MDLHPFSSLVSARVAGMLAQAKALECIPHDGLRGRFRELLVTSVLKPVLPPSCLIAHGTVIDSDGKRFESTGDKSGQKTEDDLIVVDGETISPIMFSGADGIVAIEAVLARIEVKSCLTATSLRDACVGAVQFKELGLVLDDLTNAAPLQAVFAFASDLTAKSEQVRLFEMFTELGIDPSNPPIQAICVAGKGCWQRVHFKGGPGSWRKCPADVYHREVLAFLGILVNSLPQVRATRVSARLGTYLVDASRFVDE